MYLSTFIIILLALLLYWMWTKIKYFERKIGMDNISTRMRVWPKHELYDLPLLKELAGLKVADHHVPYKDLSEEAKTAYSKFIQDKGKLLYVTFQFFYDKNLVFARDGQGHAGFSDIPSTNDYLYVADLGETKDNKIVRFNIKKRQIKDASNGKPVFVYTGYLKKDVWITSKEGKEKDDIVTLFTIPELFISPNYYFLGKQGEIITKQLEKMFDLAAKRDDNGGDFIGDFGEREYNLGLGSWHESKYYEIKY